MRTEEWYTPERYIDLVKEVLGEISLDPCSSGQANKVVGANRYYSLQDDGLSQPWEARTIYMNPPYGRGISKWIDKLLARKEQFYGAFSGAIVLVNASVSAAWFQKLLAASPAICLVNHRIKFYSPESGAEHPKYDNVFVFLGSRRARFVDVFEEIGTTTYLGTYKD